MGRGLLNLSAVLLLALGGQTALAWTPGDFPNPHDDPVKCGRAAGVQGQICDADALLSDKTKDYTAGVLQAIFTGEKPYAMADCAGTMKGYEVAVAVMRSMEVPAGSTPAQAALEFAKALHARWGVGDAACNNGVLLLLALEQRQVYISTGTGSRGPLSEERIDDIIADMRPALRRGDYDAAVERAVVDIGLALAGGKPQGEGTDWFMVALFGVFAFVLGRSGLKGLRRRREYRECRAMLAELKREQENLRSHAWSCPQSCPICLEDFTVQPPWRSSNGAADRGPKASDDEASSSATGGVDAEAGPSTSLLHSGGTTSEEEFQRMSAAGQAAVRRLRQRRRGAVLATPSGSGSGGWADGAGPSTAASAGGKEGAQPQRVPVTLGCGHTFCEPCIEQWLDKGVTCPVCRKPISEGSEGSQEQAAAQSQRARLADDWLATDLAFRLGVLQTRYPLYITPGMVDTWRSEAQSTGSFNWESNRDFQLTDPVARQHYESSGAGGFSHGFGGGSGFGGGGGGGSW